MAYALPAPAGSGLPSENSATASSSPETDSAIGNGLSYSLVPLPVYLHQEAPSNYPFEEGGALTVVSDTKLQVTASFQGAADTAFMIVIQTGSQNITVGAVTTTSEGGGLFKGSVTLAPGTYQVGLLVFVSGELTSPVGVSVPRAIQVTLSSASQNSSTTTTRTSSSSSTGERESSTTTTRFTSTTGTSSSEPSQATSSSTSTTRTATYSSAGTHVVREWAFKLVPAIVQNAPRGYRFATSGTAIVSLNAQNSLLNVVLGFQDANPSTAYSADLVLNGTSVSLGSMTTSRGGAAELHASVHVSPGTYLIDLMVYDVSDASAFDANGPVLVMLSDPNTQLAVVVPTTGEESSANSTTTSTSQAPTASQPEVMSTETTAATTIRAGSDVEAQIQGAVDSLTIPATVQITPLQSSTSVRDPRFSLSVGQQVGNGFVIAISGENVTGPRVLLINMSTTSPLALYPSLNITLDGVPVVEASSALQVLNPASSDPPRYVLVATASSIQLLVSIPHFSLHLIQIAGQLVHNIQASLALDAPLLLGSILVITLAFAGAYAARKRYFSILA